MTECKKLEAYGSTKEMLYDNQNAPFSLSSSTGTYEKPISKIKPLLTQLRKVILFHQLRDISSFAAPRELH
jgi:hypothetical protein